MKKMQCEVCGSTEIKKIDDSTFECQSCGVQYSKDDLQKLLVEITGKVKVDSTDVVANLYKAAHNERAKSNGGDCVKYYEQILIYEPNSWEALFYKDYYNLLNCRNMDFASYFNILMSGIEIAVKAIYSEIHSTEEQKKCLLEIIDKSQDLISIYTNVYQNRYQKVIDKPYTPPISNSLEAIYNAKMEKRKEDNSAFFEMVRSRMKIIRIMLTIAYSIEDVFKDSGEFSDIILMAWKNTFEWYIGLNRYTDVSVIGQEASDSCRKLVQECMAKIKEYDPSFSEIEVLYGLTPEQLTEIVALLKTEGTVTAVKKYREITGKELYEANANVRHIGADNGVQFQSNGVVKKSPEQILKTFSVFFLSACWLPGLCVVSPLFWLLYIAPVKAEMGGESSDKSKKYLSRAKIGIGINTVISIFAVAMLSIIQGI